MEGNGRTQLEAFLKDNSSLLVGLLFTLSKNICHKRPERDKTIDEINLKVRARNINTSIEDNFTLILDPVLRDKRLAKELKIKKAKEAKLAKAKKQRKKQK